MSIQYAGGTNVNSSLTQVAGTRAELAQWVRDQLVAAGWTSSGSATDYQVTSATTPQSLSCRVRCYDPGSGNCARLKFSTPSGSLTQAGDMFLLPAVGKVWRFVGNRYQFFVWSGTSARGFAAGGVPYVPSWLTASITAAIWAGSNASSDGDTTTRASFLNCLGLRNGPSAAPANQWYVYNGVAWELNNVGSGSDNPGALLLAQQGPSAALASSCYRWADLSVPVSEALVGWSPTSLSGESYLIGQLWDGAIVSDTFTTGTLLTIDGNQFRAVTDNFAGGSVFSLTWQRGTLCLYSP